ncbi:MAG: ABC transporter ATP-binding protein [Candidatus Riflebacteria bacterium]|nr:ABC transporter ATP-binding protein [Candidatus Riflebacteria bacterium]
MNIENFSLILKGSDGKQLPVLDHVNLSVKPGECLGIAGESGSGKTVLALSIMGLIPAASVFSRSGGISFRDQDLVNLAEEKLRKIRGTGISMVFQEPMSAMNPLLTLYEQIAETVRAHLSNLSEKEVGNKVDSALRRAGFDEPWKILRAYPHQLSGGMRQRAMLAMAIVLEPPLIIADEPTTALDAALQVQLLAEFRIAVKEKGHSLLFISHDLGVIRTLADHLAVLYSGSLIEYGPAGAVLSSPAHPYTFALVSSLPRLIKEKKLPHTIPGHLPSPDCRPTGCVFSDRCIRVRENCRKEIPGKTKISSDREVRCFYPL